VLELYQAEWCPFSSAVRERLTELGVDFVARQVEADGDRRDDLRARAGTDEIPVLVSEAGEIVAGCDDILAWLDARYDEHPEADRHRAQARAHA
jgi:glutathione S-transferase